MLLKCEDMESVLVLLTTHRGVFFVHNLVTAMQLLGDLGEESKLKDPLLVNEVLRDPRYDLLIRDLLRFTPQLDFRAMAAVALSLWQLDHKHYPLLSRMLQPILQQTTPDVQTVLRCAQAYHWAGYTTQHRFFAHCADAVAEAAPGLEVGSLLDACALFGSVVQCSDRFFRAAKKELLETRGLLHSRELPPSAVAAVALCFSAHLRTEHDDVLEAIAGILECRASEMTLPDIARCFEAFRRLQLRFDGAIAAGLEVAAEHLRQAWLLRRQADVRASHVALLLEASAYFGVRHDELVAMALDYLEDLVDEVNERAAINTVYAMAVLGASQTHPLLLTFLMRKIGRGSAWEAQRLRVFHLWICQQLQFPFVDVRLPPRCLNSGLRAWLQHHSGFGTPFPQEANSVADELETMGMFVRRFVEVPGTPYEVDVAFGYKSAVLVVSELSRNLDSPIGGLVLKLNHLQAKGWRAALVQRTRWNQLLDKPHEVRREYLRDLLASFS
jgi:hypothetical protein